MQRAWSDEQSEGAPARESGAVLRSAGAAEEPLAGLAALMDRLPDAVVVHRAGAVVYANAAAATLLGFATAGDLAGIAYRDLVHADQVPPPDQAAERDTLRPLARCETAAAGPLVLKSRDGAPVRVESVAVPIDTDGEREWMLVARGGLPAGLDEKLRAEHVAALSTLAAGVSHEINNPMTYLLVHLEHVTRRLRALSAGAAPGAAVPVESVTAYIDSLAQALDGARKVQKTVQRLMTFAQGAADSRSIVDARAVMESALQMAWHQIRPRAKIVKHLGEIPPVEANEARLAQVFSALLSNAASAIPEGSGGGHEVTVSTRTDEAGRVVVEVSDTGAGIEPHDIGRVFDPYFTTRAHGGGLGLGLAVAQGNVRSLGGQLACESVPGRGSTFRVTLPVAAGWAARARAECRRRVIVVDDDPQVGQALALSLAAEFDVSTLTSAQEALDRLAAGERFDAILCDLAMPPPSGIDLYAQALRFAPDAVGRIVFTTTGALTPRARAFLGSVRNVCLDKPVDEKELRAVLRRWGSEGMR
jgi:signal transduction histidine kinase/CheY-like chemotaxis protein